MSIISRLVKVTCPIHAFKNHPTDNIKHENSNRCPPILTIRKAGKQESSELSDSDNGKEEPYLFHAYTFPVPLQ